MASSFTRCGQHPRRVRSFSLVSQRLRVVVLFGPARSGPFRPCRLRPAVTNGETRRLHGHAGESGAKRLTRTGALLHGATLGGGGRTRPGGDSFADVWDKQPLSDLVNKIQI